MKRCKTDFLGKPPVAAFRSILKCLADLPETDQAHQFVLDICHCDSWDPYDKNLLITTLLSTSKIWSNISRKESTTNSKKELMKSWIAELVKIVDLPTYSREALYSKDKCLRTNFVACFVSYIQEEKKLSSVGRETAATDDMFSPLLVKLPVQKLGHLIWDNYQSDVEPSFKTFPALLELYTNICRQFVAHDLTTLFQTASNMVVAIVTCFLWLGDEQLIVLCSNKMFASHLADKPNTIYTKIAHSGDVRELVNALPLARESFCRILEQRVSVISEVLVTFSTFSP